LHFPPAVWPIDQANPKGHIASDARPQPTETDRNQRHYEPHHCHILNSSNPSSTISRRVFPGFPETSDFSVPTKITIGSGFRFRVRASFARYRAGLLALGVCQYQTRIPAQFQSRLRVTLT
jgi:hypothetical protein